MGQSPRGNSSGDYEFPVSYKEKRRRRSPSSTPSSSHTPMVPRAESSRAADISPDMDDDLRLALELSLAEEESRRASRIQEDEFPVLGNAAKGKGKSRAV